MRLPGSNYAYLSLTTLLFMGKEQLMVIHGALPYMQRKNDNVIAANERNTRSKFTKHKFPLVFRTKGN